MIRIKNENEHYLMILSKEKNELENKFELNERKYLHWKEQLEKDLTAEKANNKQLTNKELNLTAEIKNLDFLIINLKNDNEKLKNSIPKIEASILEVNIFN